ncbi:UDP-glycosyltransferase 78D2 [Platanthera guangdongensis]|uniref:UDP-glycosyltransferase 78D2 n=1 Tax=Platanthera guangdongensis TaxID=2320717 RepID=A0ABR2LV64_9ASPA
MVIAVDSSSPPPPQHVALFAFPFGTHVAPLHALARALASAAPEAIFSFISTPETFTPLPQTSGNLRLIPFEGGMLDAGSSAGVLDRIGKFLAAAPEKIGAAVKTAKANAGGVPVSCVVSDAFMWMAESTAEEMRVPWIALFSAFTLSILTHIHTDDLRSHFGIEEEAMAAHADEPLDFIPGLAAMRVRDLPEGIIHGGTNTNFSVHLRRMGQRLPRAAAVVLPTLAAFEQDLFVYGKLNLPLLIGPLNLLSPTTPISDKEHCLPWLDSYASSSVAYVAFGTVAFLPPAELAELAHGLEDSGVPFLWSIKKDLRSGLPDGFEERTRLRGKLVSWAPQVPVLSHPAVGVFVSHCGWNSTLESISAGVVMLCKPIFADQRMVARAMEEMLGVGRYFDDVITREGFVTAVDGIMRGIDGKRMRERVKKVREKTVEAMLPGGRLSENFNVLVELVRGR